MKRMIIILGLMGVTSYTQDPNFAERWGLWGLQEYEPYRETIKGPDGKDKHYKVDRSSPFHPYFKYDEDMYRYVHTNKLPDSVKSNAAWDAYRRRIRGRRLRQRDVTAGLGALALAGGAYWAYNKYLKSELNHADTKLSSIFKGIDDLVAYLQKIIAGNNKKSQKHQFDEKKIEDMKRFIKTLRGSKLLLNKANISIGNKSRIANKDAKKSMNTENTEKK